MCNIIRASLLVVCTTLLSSLGLQAQQNGGHDINNFKFKVLYFSLDSVVNNSDSSSSSTLDSVYERVCVVDLTDSNIVSFIHVDVGTKRDTTDVLSYSFVFDENEELPPSMSYYRNGSTVFLGLFYTTHSDMYHYKVILENDAGELSKPKYMY